MVMPERDRFFLITRRPKQALSETPMLDLPIIEMIYIFLRVPCVLILLNFDHIQLRAQSCPLSSARLDLALATL